MREDIESLGLGVIPAGSELVVGQLEVLLQATSDARPSDLKTGLTAHTQLIPTYGRYQLRDNQSRR